MIVEGCYYTSNVKKYMLRLFLFAIISEIPFNLIMGSSVFYPFHQNVLWTFLLGVLSIQIIEKAKKKQKKWILFFVVCLVLLMDFLLGTITMVDYNALQRGVGQQPGDLGLGGITIQNSKSGCNNLSVYTDGSADRFFQDWEQTIRSFILHALMQTEDYSRQF